MAQGVLSGMKVLDFTIALSGPYISWQLADMGAEIWKIERQKTGDQARYWDPCVPEYEKMSTLFIDYNKNKKSIEVDLKSIEGKEIIFNMVRQCDVVIENFKSGSIDRMGYGYDILKEINPKIVFLSLSGFGGSGPLRKLPCYDAIAAARGGFAASNGEPDGAPMKAGNANCDTLTATYAVNAVLMGVIQARKTGKGSHIDIGMSDVVMESVAEQIIDYGHTGSTEVRFGNHDRFIAPYGIFEARDGWISIIADTEVRWKKLCQILRVNLADRDCYKDNQARVEHREQLVLELEKATMQFKREELEELLLKEDVPAAQMMPFMEVFTSKQANTTESLAMVYQKHVGNMLFYTNPIRFDNQVSEIRMGSPLLGEHTTEILQQLGYDDEKIRDLFEKEIVFSTRI